MIRPECRKAGDKTLNKFKSPSKPMPNLLLIIMMESSIYKLLQNDNETLILEKVNVCSKPHNTTQVMKEVKGLGGLRMQAKPHYFLTTATKNA